MKFRFKKRILTKVTYYYLVNWLVAAKNKAEPALTAKCTSHLKHKGMSTCRKLCHIIVIQVIAISVFKKL